MSGRNDSPASSKPPCPKEAWVCFALPTEIGQPLPRPSPHIILTGMGPANARRVLDQELRRLQPRLLLTCGLAGGLNPKLNTGDVLFSADASFPGLDRLRAAGARPGTFHGAARILSRAVEKKEVWQATGEDAVEMESHVLRAICHAHHIPSATLRVISDTAWEDLPVDFNQLVTADWRLHYGKLAWTILKRPSLVSGLRHLQGQARRASNRLAQVLRQYFEG